MLCYFKGHGQIFHCQLLSYKQANRDHGHTCDSAGQGSNQIQLKKKKLSQVHFVHYWSDYQKDEISYWIS